MRRGLIPLLALLSLVASPTASAAGDPDVAALQVALKGRGYYSGPIDGSAQGDTVQALQAFQSRAGLVPDGIAGIRTRAALGAYGRWALGSRRLVRGMSGWDVAAAQFLLGWRGFPSGSIDGVFGPRLESAVSRFQQWASLPVVGAVGSATLAALRIGPPRSPVALAWPLRLPVADAFGPRGDRFHTGVDIPATSGLHVAAAAAGVVTYAGWHPGGWGYLVEIEHTGGLSSMYAHLLEVDVAAGLRVRAGALVGHVGSSGHSTGPHLHFEVRLRGASIDPLSALVTPD